MLIVKPPHVRKPQKIHLDGIGTQVISQLSISMKTSSHTATRRAPTLRRLKVCGYTHGLTVFVRPINGRHQYPTLITFILEDRRSLSLILVGTAVRTTTKKKHSFAIITGSGKKESRRLTAVARSVESLCDFFSKFQKKIRRTCEKAGSSVGVEPLLTCLSIRAAIRRVN